MAPTKVKKGMTKKCRAGPFYRGSNYPSQIMMSSCQIRSVPPNKVTILGKSQHFLETKNAINRSDATQAQKNRTVGLHKRKWSAGCDRDVGKSKKWLAEPQLGKSRNGGIWCKRKLFQKLSVLGKLLFIV